jgi:hypothetical protein
LIKTPSDRNPCWHTVTYLGVTAEVEINDIGKGVGVMEIVSHNCQKGEGRALITELKNRYGFVVACGVERGNSVAVNFWQTMAGEGLVKRILFN